MQFFLFEEIQIVQFTSMLIRGLDMLILFKYYVREVFHACKITFTAE